MTPFILHLDDPVATDPERVGPKAANLAGLMQSGLPTPGGFALTADAYRHQLRHLGIEDLLRQYSEGDVPASRRISIQVRLALYQGPIAPEILEPLLGAWRKQGESAPLGVVRSSALIEDRKGANFAGQFESFLGLSDETEFLTAVRACWAALWTSHARRYMENHELSPADTAMGVLIQPLISARASGGGLSETADGQMMISATWGLGSAIAQGEVVPDRIVLSKTGFLRTVEAGRKGHRDTCAHGVSAPELVPKDLVSEPCLSPGEAVTLGRLLRKCEDLAASPVEIEWAMDETGFKLLQSRPLHMEPAIVPDEIWLQHPGLNGHPAGIGWGSGRAVVVNCECELSRVAPGDVLVTRVAGPALSPILTRVSGVVAELGGSTSHLASLARERGIPMVLGVLDATRKIPGRRTVRRRRRCRRRAVAQVSAKPRVFVTQPIADSAVKRLRELGSVKVFPDDSRIIPHRTLVAAVRKADILFCLLHDKIDRTVIAANPKLRHIASQSISPSNVDVAEATKRGIPVTVVPPVTTEATADLNFGLMLSLARRMIEGDRLVRAGKFPGGQSRHLLGSIVHGRTIGLIGGGGLIGKAVARRAHGFSMRVLYWTPRRKSESEEREAGITFMPLDELLRESDFVSLHSPLNAQTRHQIGAREIGLMKKTAFIINTARGPIIDEAVLVRALKSKKIAGAGLDVFEHEPKVHADLKKLKNVVLEPHLGSATVEVREQMANIVVDNIEAVLGGRVPPNCVNPQVLGM